jgi:hypothetical protein
MKTFFIFFLLSSFITAHSQLVVRIDFRYESSADFDLLIKEGLESIGYSAYVNYHNRRAEEHFDYLIEYDEVDDVFILELYNDKHQQLKNTRQRINNYNYSKAISTGLSDLIDMKVRIVKDTHKEKFNISSSVRKIDSAVYVISTQGAAVRSESETEQAFLEKAKALTSNYKIYYKNSKYQYSYQYGWQVTQHVASKTEGVVIGITGSEPIRIDEPPELYNNYREHKTAHFSIPVMDHESESSKIFIIRDTGFVGSAGRFRFFMNDELICKIANKRYSVHKVEPGKHMIGFRERGRRLRDVDDRLVINVEPGEIVYIQLFLESGLATNLTFLEMDKYEAKLQMSKLLRNESCD